MSFLKAPTPVFWIGLTLATTGHSFAGEFDPKAAVRAMRERLLTVLTEELKKGPAQAIDACHEAAPAIPIEQAKLFAKNKVTMGRTSSKLRSSANAPREWIKPLLKEFASSTSKTPAPAKVVKLGKARQGYVEPIYIGPPCLACHGEKIEKSVVDKLAAKYPKDEARGYKLGEFRGLIWVEWEG